MKKMRLECNDKERRDICIYNNFFKQDFIKKTESFFIYNSFGSEVDTSKIIRELLKRKKKVYLPKVNGNEMFLIEYFGQAMQNGKFGVYEPVGEPENIIPEVCVLPMLAADKYFSRLGYGGGFYDRYLTDKQIYKVGLCYSFQITEKVPVENTDVQLDLIITDTLIFSRR